MSYEESLKEESDSVFMRVIKKACGRSWQTSPIKRSLNGRSFPGPQSSWGLSQRRSGRAGNLVCEKCHFHLPIYTPEVRRYARNVVMTSSRDARLSRNV